MISEKELNNLLNNVSKIISVEYTTDNLENNTCDKDVLIEENTILCIFSKHVNDAIDEKKQQVLLKMLNEYKNEKNEEINVGNRPTITGSAIFKNQIVRNNYQLYEPSISAANLKQKLDKLQKENEINRLSNNTPINPDSPLISNSITTVDYSNNDQLIEQSLDAAYSEYKTYWRDVRNTNAIVIPEGLYSSQSIEPVEEFADVQIISKKVLNTATGEYIEHVIEKPTKTRKNAKTS